MLKTNAILRDFTKLRKATINFAASDSPREITRLPLDSFIKFGVPVLENLAREFSFG